MKSFLKKCLNKVNAPKVICDHLLGKEHPHEHRMVVGAFVMTVGVLIAKSEHAFHYAIWQICTDVVGYAIHGLGFAPYIEWLMAGADSAQVAMSVDNAGTEEDFPKLDFDLVEISQTKSEKE